jgi:hypothetical protein
MVKEEIVQRWTDERRIALILNIVCVGISVQEATRKHWLNLAEVEA